MKTWSVALYMMLLATCTILGNAEAGRLSASKGSGNQAQTVSRTAPTTADASEVAPPMPGARPSGALKGAASGALFGLGLGVMFAQLGLSPAVGNAIGFAILLALGFGVALILWRITKSFRHKPVYAGAYKGSKDPKATRAPKVPKTRDWNTRIDVSHTIQPLPRVHNGPIPAGFDQASFLRSAKYYFIRLQGAWDRADLNDIREFSTPQMLSELRLQLQQRGNAVNHTDVIDLEADLLSAEVKGSQYVASVRFTGTIREDRKPQAKPFTEIWNLNKAVYGESGWILSGIQQLQ